MARRRTLDFEKIAANPNAQVRVVGDSISVEGVFVNDFQVRAGNNWNTLAESNVAQSGNSLLQAGNLAQGMFNQLAGTDLQIAPKGVSLGNLQQTAKQWTGSETPVFSLDLIFLALRSGDDVTTKVNQLYASVFPGGQTSIATLSTPLGYTVGQKALTADGTLNIGIGRWFLAYQQVMNSVNFTFSKEITPDGGPLYARGTIEFTSFRALTYREFRSYFRTSSRVSTQSNPDSKEVTDPSRNSTNTD
jgi:hypothetical protein